MAATLSILGLYNYQPAIFDSLTIPTSVDRETLIDNIIMEAAELELLFPNADILGKLIGNWSKTRLAAWNRMIGALDAEYNPIENTDRYEDHLEDYTRDLKESDDYNRNLTDSGNSNSSGSIQNSRTGYNSSDLQLTDSSGSEDHSDDSRSYTGGDNRNKGYTGGDTRHTVIHTHGNIGVTTNQQMVDAELKLRQYDIYKLITNEFIDTFCIGVY
nr:MAG TPA: hypothetical protein [Caudoviricetes sp.]